jgi:predicted DsbA family dithiol-disulfide isomerase
MMREARPGETGDKLREPLGSRAEAEGLVMRRPSFTPFTMPVLEATEYAREVGKDEAFFGQTMRAYWEEGVNLGEMDVLESLAKSSDLDWDELKPRLESGHYRDQVTEQHREAVSLGIQGIPAFLIGNLLFTGAQPYEVFKKVIDRVLNEPA